MELTSRVASIIEQVRVEFAPDPRLAVFEVACEHDPDGITLLGATSEPAAAETLHRRVALLDAGVEVRDEVRLLPDAEDDLPVHALVCSAAAPMMAGPVVSESHVSQALLGQRVLVLRQRGRWLQCRTEDGYLGWVHRGYLSRVAESDARAWEMGTAGESCFSLGARLRGEDGEVVARLPWGCRFVRHGERATVPDGRTGLLEGDCVPVAEQRRRFPPTGEAIVETAVHWLESPYFWGGTTPDGVDCSGLVQALYRTHGILLPRDSDMQARAGEAVEPGRDFSELRPGDLLFFAEEPGRITHVVLSLGGSRIIHSSLGNGGVRRNDLLGSHGYEEELRRLYVCARRMIA